MLRKGDVTGLVIARAGGWRWSNWCIGSASLVGKCIISGEFLERKMYDEDFRMFNEKIYTNMLE